MSGVVVLLALAVAYFLPSLIAFARGRQVVAIFVLNLILGVTGLGWCIALIWSLTERPAHER